ncbi:hypothetical protein [Lutibacter flavus]|uniref:Uncharacterized protein n=1 Tax=Lutibacter flavus TaxID=691689 RepID=A0A238YW50_9FLAO|nr:hypothetical protein [Lutibacter flavus]SNR75516.1 hypothetical protein SAMN04488111_2889 [Lutibacter flavus]
MNNTPNQFIEEFKKKYEETPNKKYLLDNEIRQIDIYTSSNEVSFVSSNHPLDIGLGFIADTNSVFTLRILDSFSRGKFNVFFNHNLLGTNYSPGKYEPDDWYNDKMCIQGNAFAEYYKWLNELKEQPLSSPKQKKSTLTHSQKILALYYLGIDMSKFQNNVQSAKILSSILDLDYTNTKEFLTYFEGKKPKVKNKSNIKKMSELFEHQIFKCILDEIKKDL